MPDISMCVGGNCPKKDSCYRYTATPTPKWQSYFCKPPYNKKTKACANYWENDYIREE